MKTICWIGCLGTLLAALPAAPAQETGTGLSVKKGEDALEFYAGGELVTRYLTAPTWAKPIFWPLNAPGGVPLTRDWPMVKGRPGESIDHIHQKSAWFCHGDILPEGVELKKKIKGVAGVDFWSEAIGHGQMVCTKVGEPEVGKDRITVRTHNDWQTADAVKIMDEDRTIHFYDLGPARLLVLDIDLVAAVPLVFDDTKEGSMGIRINDQITADKKGKGTIQNAEGKRGEKDCWGRISAWCDYSGPIDGKEVGLALLADPRNPNASCWHVRGYGLMAANPFGRDKAKFSGVAGRFDTVRLGRGARYRLRYGLLLHAGDAQTGRVAEHYQRFVQLREQEGKGTP
jgi:hypothetical protein